MNRLGTQKTILITRPKITSIMPDIVSIIRKAKEYNMPAVALTDLGNMFGAFKFVREALAHEIKPIVGCEFYVAEERLK